MDDTTIRSVKFALVIIPKANTKYNVNRRILIIFR